MGISRVCYLNFVNTDSTQVVVLFFGNTVQSKSMRVIGGAEVCHVDSAMYDVCRHVNLFFFVPFISLLLLLLQSLMLR